MKNQLAGIGLELGKCIAAHLSRKTKQNAYSGIACAGCTVCPPGVREEVVARVAKDTGHKPALNFHRSGEPRKSSPPHLSTAF
jgi:hypothetical protein